MSPAQVRLRQMALLAILTAMAVALRVARLIPIPNFQPVTDIIMIVTMQLGLGFGLALAVLTMVVSNLFLGFGIWTIPQIAAYAVCVLVVAALAKLPPVRQHFSLQIIMAAALGYLYGLIVNFGSSIYGGWAAFIAFTAGSLLFDTYHCLGNIVFYPLLDKPLTLALDRYERRIQ